MRTKEKGFTLIELLVVIAIIGLLSTMAVVSLNSARGKARDAKRVSDVKQLSNVIEMEAANTASGAYTNILPAACRAVGTLTTACATFGGVDWTTITDASGGTTPCVAGAAGAGNICAYTMRINNAITDDYEICFYLEEGAGGLAKGNNKVTKGGVISGGCD
ncbi:MAG: type II secretion system GspH family protein [Methanoregula sp.]|jgi:prepilin-type N-terminal cleavage/methylation domain-containing protein|nr:type II secretion system GspH family protein [Methanoregula sp.]